MILKSKVLARMVALVGFGMVQIAMAGAEPAGGTDPAAEIWAVHGQFTYVEQNDTGFHAPYSGAYSLTPARGKETTDATLWVGAALWAGAEGWISPEIDQGFGLDNTLGAAGFPSGEAYKVGKNQPYLRLPRIFVRDTLSLGGDTVVGSGGEAESVTAAAGWLGGTRSVDRWVFTVGKFGVTDIFDANQYAHDPRGDFLNWSAIDAGAFDYAADAWGFTAGAVVEWYHGSWAVRAGVFDLSNVPNSAHLEPGFHEFQLVTEAEHHYRIADRPGRALITLYDSRGRMGLLDAAVALAEAANTPVDIAAVRAYRSRLGAAFNLEQALTTDLGLFARVSKAAGNVEAYEFTDIDRSVEVGMSLKGNPWHRAGDTVGLGIVDNGISAERERYLNAGGLGILVGDGRLPHPAPEEILETYYNAALLSFAVVGFDYQFIKNPAYNRDRGPVSVFALRLHAQF